MTERGARPSRPIGQTRLAIAALLAASALVIHSSVSYAARAPLSLWVGIVAICATSNHFVDIVPLNDQTLKPVDRQYPLSLGPVPAQIYVGRSAAINRSTKTLQIRDLRWGNVIKLHGWKRTTSRRVFAFRIEVIRQSFYTPACDVPAIHALLFDEMRGGPVGPYIGPIRVVGQWAAGTWINDGGGTALLKRTPSGWVILTGGGGFACPSDFVTLFHVPPKTAVELLPENTRSKWCIHRR